MNTYTEIEQLKERINHLENLWVNSPDCTCVPTPVTPTLGNIHD